MAARRLDALFTLPFPAQSGRRIAALEQTWGRYEGITVFDRQHWKELRAFEPDILIASSSVLKQLGEETARGLLEVGCAVFVMTQLGDPSLTEEDRDFFWNVFDVPAWELLIDPSGEILGAECELHEGWHLQGSGKVLTEPYEGRLDETPCPCGWPSPRFIALTRKSLVKTVTASAATEPQRLRMLI